MKIEIDLKKIKQLAEEKEDEIGEFCPKACRSYPHLHEEKFDSRLMEGIGIGQHLFTIVKKWFGEKE